MSDNETRLSFGEGVTISKLQAAASRATLLGVAMRDAGKVLAIAAVLSGADIDDTVNSTGVKRGVIVKGRAYVQNGNKGKGLTPRTISERMHALPFADVIAWDGESMTGDVKDAFYALAHFWSDNLAETTGGSGREPISPAKFADNIRETILGKGDKVNDAKRQQLLFAAARDALAWIADQAAKPESEREDDGKRIAFKVTRSA